MTTLRTLTLATLLLAALTTLAHADVTEEPGYFDMEWIVIPDDAAQGFLFGAAMSEAEFLDLALREEA